MSAAPHPDPLHRELAIFQSLASAHCPCGQSKRRRQSFCLGCFRQLPAALRQRLYKTDGYSAAWLEAMQALGLDSKPQLTLI